MFWAILGMIFIGAIVNGPLFSLDASGAIGKALVYTKWKGRNVVREYVTPANPNSLLQRGRRTMLAVCNTIWQSMTQLEKDDWQGLAAATNISTFNAFTGYNLDRQTGSEAPVVTADVTGVAPAEPDSITAVGGANRVDFTSVLLTAVPGTYALITLEERVSPPGANYALIVAAKNLETTANWDVAVTDLPPGVYSATLWTFSDTGLEGGITVNQTAFTVTGV